MPLSASLNAPPIITHNSDTGAVLEMLDAAGRGDVTSMTYFSLSLHLGFAGHDIQILTQQGEYYSPLETNADALNNLLQTHKKDTVNINDIMKRYLDRAVEVMRLQKGSVPVDIQSAIRKLKLNQGISEQEAKKLFSWSNEAKEFVIPSGFRAQVLSNQIEHSQNKYQTTIQEYTQLISQLFPFN